MQYYFGKVQELNKGEFKQLLKRAVVRIANGLTTPHIKFDSEGSTNNTAYKYVNKKLFNCKSTNFDTLEHIKEALENHGIDVPTELTQALGEHGKRKDKSKS